MSFTRCPSGRRYTYRYVLLEAGHRAEGLYLAATSLGLGACAIDAFFDDEVNRLVEVDGKGEAVVYLVSIGSRPKHQSRRPQHQRKGLPLILHIYPDELIYLSSPHAVPAIRGLS